MPSAIQSGPTDHFTVWRIRRRGRSFIKIRRYIVTKWYINYLKNSSLQCQNSQTQARRFLEHVTFQFSHLDINSLESIIRNLKSNASGTDGISVQMIQLALPVIIPFLLHIHSCLESGYFFNQWKTALVLPLPKKCMHGLIVIWDLSVLMSKIFFLPFLQLRFVI